MAAAESGSETVLSQILVGCLDGQPDVCDGMFELVAALTVEDGSEAASTRLLQHDCLPLGLAERLVARRGVSAAELAAFAAREDMPPATLLEWVRQERRVTVLAQIAAKPGLPQEIYDALSTREGFALRQALLHNDTAPLNVRAVAAAALLGSSLPYRDRLALRDALDGSEPLQRAVFDRLTRRSLGDCLTVSRWPGLAGPQLHTLLDVVERHVAARWESYRKRSETSRASNNRAFRTAAACTVRLAEHPAADAALLDRVDAFVDSCGHRLLRDPGLADSVDSARRRLAAFDGVSVASVSHKQLVEFADAGVLDTPRVAGLAANNPLFDDAVAARILAASETSAGGYGPDRSVAEVLVKAAPGLPSALRRYRAVAAPLPFRLLEQHICAASADALAEALSMVDDDPEWVLRLARAFAEHADPDTVTDDVVGRFGWFGGLLTGRDEASRLLCVWTVDFLFRRFGDHVPAWRVFANIADPSTPLAEAAALAVRTEPPPDAGTVSGPAVPSAQRKKASL